GRLVATGRHVVATPNEREAEQSDVGEQALDDLGVTHAQVAETRVAVGLRVLVEQRAGTEPLDEPAQLTRRDHSLPKVDERDRDAPLLEETQGGAGRLVVLEPEDLDLNGLWGRHRRRG